MNEMREIDVVFGLKRSKLVSRGRSHFDFDVLPVATGRRAKRKARRCP